ncbi:MAG: DNA primase DnaG [Olavius algarvensis Delta 4 endosymbiont]|nr:MAG: DNA primase DnaG [Olavius algarvensis Delta 4 endosymbiont]
MAFLAGLIPEDKIAEIKNAADIVDIVSESVALKKAGQNHIGLCPFHSEKTPSFTVSPVKQIFHCFGCGAGGNVFRFLMKHQGLSFPEAVRSLAGRYGIDLPEREMSPAERQRMDELDQIRRINQIAGSFYQRCLTESRIGQSALAYLERRGIDRAAIDRFQLGFAPAGWDNLTTLFTRKRVPLRQAEKTGLLVPRKNSSGYYDRFRERVMFPIFNTAGSLIGFGGRVLDDALPKYMNSPESPLYNKSRSLYGINWARNRSREQRAVYIVEGYLDMLKLHVNGIENSVATLGTALTPQHIRMLKGCVGEGRMILVYDSDQAGLDAAYRSLDLFLKEHADFRKGDVFRDKNADTRIMILPEGHDPDSYISDKGREEFLEKAQMAPGLVTFLFDMAVKRHGLTTEGKIKIVADLSGTLAVINDQVARSLYVKELAERLNIDENAILAKIRESVVRGRQPRARKLPATPEGTGQNSPERPVVSRGTRLERQILAMMLQYPDIIKDIEDRDLLSQFADGPLKSIGQKVLAGRRQGRVDIPDLMSILDNAAEQELAAELAIGNELWHHWDRQKGLQLINQLEKSKARREDDLLQRIKAAEAENNQPLLLQLLKEKQLQAKERH